MENKHGSIMIGEGVRIEGKIDSATDVHVYGTVIGEINTQDLFVGETGNVNGIVVADNIEVRGQIQKNIEVRQTLVIKSTGRISGNISYLSLEIENGGTIDGKIDKYNPKKDSEPSKLLSTNKAANAKS
jgi:cytoskeletal protein CcmA (bactofilin family)